MRLESLYDGKFNGVSCDSKKRNVLMIKSFLTEITQQAVEEGQVCTHRGVIISQDSGYLYVSGQEQRKKDTKFLKKDLPSTQFFRNGVISCFDTKMSIFVKSSLQKHAFSRNIVRLSHIRRCSDRIIRDFLSGKNKTNKTSYTQKPVFTIRNYGHCYFSLFSREVHK